MIEHKILINECFWDCFGTNGSPIITETLNLYEINLTDGYLFEYTRELDKTDAIEIDCKVYINKGSNILIWSFTLTTNSMLHFTFKNGDYSMLYIPKSDINNLTISQQNRFNRALPFNVNAIIEFKNNQSINFDLRDCEPETIDSIIKFIINLAQY